MEAPKCKLCGDRHWGMCPDTDVDKLTESIKRSIAEGRAQRRESAERAADEVRVTALQHQAGFRRLYEDTGLGVFGPESWPCKPKLGRPRIEDKGKSFEDTKPWLALNMSRTTWYRRRATEWVCVNGHDRCRTSYPGPDCPYCERRRREQSK